MQTDDNTTKVLSAEILVSIPIDEFSKETVTCTALLNTGSSKPLTDRSLMSEYAKKGIKKSPTCWKTHDGDFITEEKTIVDNVRLPQFTTKRKFAHKFNLFKKDKDDR